ncbi:hypothetical protein [Actinoplanes sp. NPDC051494]|uniref:hypothetical protein n=1 Tax=Actinoplanes sp. NPDC051494 TaxID=3363907 RepID=UPI0037AF0569
MTDYSTEPVTGKVYGNSGLREVAIDAWVGVDHTLPADLSDWHNHRRLLLGPYGLFLAFEQGRNAPPCVFALKSNPGVDLANADGFRLRDLPDDPDDETFPATLRDLYWPVAELTDRLAADTRRSIRDRGVEVMTLLFARIAELGIVRAQEFDDGDLIGLDRDIAAELPAAWAALIAEEGR